MVQGTLFKAESTMETISGIERTAGRLNHHGHELWNFDVDNAVDALKASGLDWEVSKRPLFYKKEAAGESPADAYSPVSGYAVVQDGGDRDKLVHGIVSSRYTPIQNREITPVLDPLLRDGHFRVKQGGITAHNRCWMIADSARVDDITGKGDNVTHHLLIHWKHDGRSSVRADFVAQRTACSNAIQTMFDDAARSGQRTLFNINHHHNFDHTMNIVADILQAQAKMADRTVEALKFLAKSKMLHPKNFFDHLVPKPDVDELTEQGYQRALVKRRMVLNAMEERYERGLGVELRENGTAWAAYCAATEAVDHYLINTTRSDGVEFRWFGGGSDLRIAAFGMAMKAAQAA